MNADLTSQLHIQQALNIARNAEDGLEPSVASFLEEVMSQIWDNTSTNSDTYVLSALEFAVFNFYRQQYHGQVAEEAVERYWRSVTRRGAIPVD